MTMPPEPPIDENFAEGREGIDPLVLTNLPDLANEFENVYAGLTPALQLQFRAWMTAHAAMYFHLENQDNEEREQGRGRGRVTARRRDDIDPTANPEVFEEMLEAIGNSTEGLDLRNVIAQKPWTTTTIHPNTSRYA